MTTPGPSSFSTTTTGKEVAEAFADQIAGKTIIVTGASKGGLGEQTCLALAHGHPSQLISIQSISPSTTARFIPLDLNSLRSVRKCAEEINSRVGDKIDVLINNAGTMATDTFVTTADGVESQVGANHVGPFLLTNLLAGRMGEGTRVVNVTSMGYEICGVRFDEWNFQNGKTYNPWYGYGQSKTANLLFAESLAEKLAERGAQAYAVHPGLILSSNLISGVSQETFALGVKMRNEVNPDKPAEMEAEKTLEQGCSTALVAALDPSIKGNSGGFLRDCQISKEPVSEHARDPVMARKLWELSEEIVGQKFEI